MSWPNDRVLCRALHELLELVGLGAHWTADGPTDRAWALYKRGGGPLSSSERQLFLAAFALWNANNTKAAFGLVVQKLDDANLEALLSLARACCRGDEAVEAWIVDADARRGRGPATELEHALLRAAIRRDPPGDDLLAWLIRWLPDDTGPALVLTAYSLFLRGAYGAVEHVDEEPRKYDVAGGTLTATRCRLVPGGAS